MKRPRFSLLALFFFVTTLALFFGYSQWRRQDMLRQVAAINRLGGQVELPNDYRDYLWQRTPAEGVILLYPGRSPSEAARAVEKLAVIEERMKALRIRMIIRMGE